MKQFFAKIGAFLKRHKVATIVVSCVLVALIMVLPHLCCLVFNRISVGTVPTTKQINYVRENNLTYDRVVIFGIDGSGDYYKHSSEDSNFNKIFGDGAVTFNGMSMYPTVSAPNWTSMFYGVNPIEHGVTNEKAYHIVFDGAKLNNSRRFTSIFEAFAKDAKKRGITTFSTSSISQWHAINVGVVEDVENLCKITLGQVLSERNGVAKDLVLMEDEDNNIVPAIDEGGNVIESDHLKMENGKLTSEYIGYQVSYQAARRVAELNAQGTYDSIMFLCYDYVDWIGERYGYGSKEYAHAALEVADDYMGIVYRAYEKAGLLDGTLFICISDHGQKYSGGHGHNQPTVRRTTFAVAGTLANGGTNVRKGTCGKVTNKDLASVVLYALGVKQPSSYQSKVPYKMFKTLK